MNSALCARPAALHVQDRQSSAFPGRGLFLNVVRFLAVGLAGLSADSALFLALASWNTAEPIARAASLICATALTWQLNRRFTFGDSERRSAPEAARYAAVALGAQGLNYLIFLSLRTELPHVPALASLLVGAVAAAAFSYTGQRFITFRGRVRA